jgi:hypothetical protein
MWTCASSPTGPSSSCKPAFTLVPIAPARLTEKRASGDHFFQTILSEGVLIAAQD